MSYVIVAVDSQTGDVYVGGDATGQPFATKNEAEQIAVDHYDWINVDGVFGKAHVVAISDLAE